MLLTATAPEGIEMQLWSNEPPHDFDESNPGSIRVGFKTRLSAHRKSLLKVILVPTK